MYRTIQDFLADWNRESDMTLKVFRNLTDASLCQKVTPEGRSLGSLAWHIILSIGEMGNKAGLNVVAPPEDTPVPHFASVIISAYEKAGTSVAPAVQYTWKDSMLIEEIEMYGEKWTRGAALSALNTHQIHHRAQMTILMRQAGLQVPGVYGPSREEWSQYGMSAPE